jgi:hypothetical protein
MERTEEIHGDLLPTLYTKQFSLLLQIYTSGEVKVYDVKVM